MLIPQQVTNANQIKIGEIGEMIDIEKTNTSTRTHAHIMIDIEKTDTSTRTHAHIMIDIEKTNTSTRTHAHIMIDISLELIDTIKTQVNMIVVTMVTNIDNMK